MNKRELNSQGSYNLIGEMFVVAAVVKAVIKSTIKLNLPKTVRSAGDEAMLLRSFCVVLRPCENWKIFHSFVFFFSP